VGHWTMVIHGHGIHGNGIPDDADQLLKEFILRLRGHGHEVEHAAITTGMRQVPTAPGIPVAVVEHSAPVSGP
jgi:hypothetical protein